MISEEALGWEASRLSDVMLQFQRLSETAENSVTLVICDPVLSDPVEAWRAAGLDIPETKRIRCALGRQMQPYLFELSSDHQGELLLQETLATALAEAHYAAENVPAPRSVCAWAQISRDDVTHFQAELERKAHSPRREGKELSGIFRFWDPRVFVHLPRIFGAGFSGWFDMPMRWCWINGGGALEEIRFTATAGQCGTLDVSNPRICQALENLEYINQGLVHTQQIRGGQEAEHGARLERYVRDARQLGCVGSRDIVMYMATAIQVGARFELAPCLKAAMHSFLSGQMAFAQVAMGVSDELWAQARSELASVRQKIDGVV